ncbi:MAG: hypothetical protein D6719_04300 [Candidatus Dadabacteria bacterium]|nr:MAG: hypothetical protein D6719_04300 [Candidatus Dadabacteria bacterium]
MAQRSSEKIIEALSMLMEGFSELQESVEQEFGKDSLLDDLEEEEEENGVNEEIDAAIVTEIRAAIETVMETDDYSTEEFATLVSTMTDALEEIDPDVFEDEEGSDDYEVDIDDEGYDDLDDDDDLYYDEDDEYEEDE